jgi:hypothetical protein
MGPLVLTPGEFLGPDIRLGNQTGGRGLLKVSIAKPDGLAGR